MPIGAFDEAIGYVAAGLVLATFLMRTMVPLRILGTASNIAFITYGWLNGLTPVLLLHAVLLPVNIYRLVEIQRFIASAKRYAGTSDDLSWLLPFATVVSVPNGDTVFEAGDDADAFYVVEAGSVTIEPIGAEIGEGQVFGEVGVFSKHKKRIATAVASDQCRLRRVSIDLVHRLVVQHPEFGYAMLRLITERLVENLERVEARLASTTAKGP